MNNTHAWGFSLIELAITLAIIALIAGTGIQVLTTQLVNTQITNTKSGEQAIKAAIVNYVLRNNRLPCPATEGLTPTQANYGREARIAAGCDAVNLTAITFPVGGPLPTSFRGVVPWLTLGLNAPATLGAAPTGNQLNACSAVITDKSCNLEAVAMIVSHGANGNGAFTLSGQRMPPNAGHVLEAENADDVNERFVATDYSDNTANPFDDIVLAIAPNDILGTLIKDGSVVSSQSSTNDLLRRTRDVVIANIVNSAPTRGLVPTTGALVLPTDVWGNTLTYVRNTADVCSAASGADAFTLTSLGPNNIPNVVPPTAANDDIVLTQNTASLQTTIFNLGTACP